MTRSGYPILRLQLRKLFDGSEYLGKFQWRTKAHVYASPSFGEIAHSLIKDDEFEGYHFPAGTTFVWNHWGIHNDPKEYDQPERFWPDRFLNEDIDKPIKGHLGFGTGKSTLLPTLSFTCS